METTRLGHDGPMISSLALGGAPLGGVYCPISQAVAEPPDPAGLAAAEAALASVRDLGWDVS